MDDNLWWLADDTPMLKTYKVLVKRTDAPHEAVFKMRFEKPEPSGGGGGGGRPTNPPPAYVKAVNCFVKIHTPGTISAPGTLIPTPSVAGKTYTGILQPNTDDEINAGVEDHTSADKTGDGLIKDNDLVKVELSWNPVALRPDMVDGKVLQLILPTNTKAYLSSGAALTHMTVTIGSASGQLAELANARKQNIFIEGDAAWAAGGLVPDITLKVDGLDYPGAEAKALLLPVEVLVNETEKEEDDFVAVSAGTDQDLATDFSVKVTGVDTVTATLSLKNTDGNLDFKDATLNLTDGVAAKTKLWGITPSSDRDKTIIVILLKKDGKELAKIEEKVTVFEGVNIEFEGTFVANVNSIPEGWRPNPAIPAEAVASTQDVDEYVGFLQFQDGDQFNKRRSWTPAPTVTIQKVETVRPKIILTAAHEVLIGSQISAKSGFFQPGAVPDARKDEYIRNFKIELRKAAGGDIYASAEIDAADETAHLEHPSGDLASLAGWTLQADIEAKIDADTAPPEIKSYYKSEWLQVEYFLPIRQQWINRKLKFLKMPMTQKSFAIKGILGSQELKSTPDSSIKLDLQRYNIWYLSGEIKNGLLTTEVVP